MKFAIITTCMGRAEHLKVTLPKMLAQEGVEHSVVVVDWDSKDDLHEVLWLNRGPKLNSQVFRGKKTFHLSAARNNGGEFAWKHLDADYLAFIDADILLPPDFLKRNQLMLNNREPDVFLQSKHTHAGDNQVWGSCIVPAEAWLKVKYNERIRMYGHEDNELYSYLESQGLKHHPMDVQGVEAIEHSDELRFQNHPGQTRETDNRAVNLPLFRVAPSEEWVWT